MVNIPEICDYLQKGLEQDKTHEETLNRCINNKLNALYINQSKEYDRLIDSIEKALDMDNIENVCHIVSKLSRNIKQNRQRLIDIIERCEQ